MTMTEEDVEDLLTFLQRGCANTVLPLEPKGHGTLVRVIGFSVSCSVSITVSNLTKRSGTRVDIVIKVG